jgi:hypothetical protein
MTMAANFQSFVVSLSTASFFICKKTRKDYSNLYAFVAISGCATEDVHADDAARRVILRRNLPYNILPTRSDGCVTQYLTGCQTDEAIKSDRTYARMAVHG